MTVSINGTSGVTFNDASTQNTAATGFGFKNRILNGQMVLDQRNAGASVTQTNTVPYTVDRWYVYGNVNSKFTAQRSTDAPAGFSNSMLITSSAAYSVPTSEQYIFTQPIEGFNCSDLGFGTANASTITLSFWVKSSLTGTFAGGLANAGSTRSYPFSFVINSANTWEQKAITIAGDTAGTWLRDNGVGLYVNFSMGTGSTFQSTVNTWSSGNFKNVSGAVNLVGTNGATFYITGVQLEKGSTATSFDYRPYGTELALCQRYYAKLGSLSGNYVAFGSGVVGNTTSSSIFIKYPQSMRAAPTLTQSNCAVNNGSGSYAVTSINTSFYGTNSMNAQLSQSAGATAGNGCILLGSNSATAYIDLSAEL